MHLRTPVDLPDEMFRELGWLPPNRAAPHYEAILVGHELTVLRALADELRRAGGRPSDDDGATQIAEPIDLSSVPVRLAKFRRYRHFWMTISIIGVVLYLILIIALLPILVLAWIVAMLHDASLTKRRLFLYRFRFRGRLLAERQFDRNQRFARYLLDRIGRSGGSIGARRWLARSRINCRLPAREWAGRQRAWAMGRIPWPGTAELVCSLGHTTFGAPWYIQFADHSPEPLSDWLDREMRRVGEPA